MRGQKNIVPDDETKYQISRIGQPPRRGAGKFRLCLDETGVPESVVTLRSTDVPDYDRKILTRMKEWAYRPFVLSGRPVPVCTAVTFIYTQY